MPTRLCRQRRKLYVSSVIVAGALAVLYSGIHLLTGSINSHWLLLAALTIVSGSATVRLPSIPASLSVSETFVFTSVLLFGAPAGTLTVALDGLIISLWLSKRRKEAYRVLFNMAAPSLLSGLPQNCSLPKPKSDHCLRRPRRLLSPQFCRPSLFSQLTIS